MADKKVDFYGDKPASLPRLVYRRLRDALTRAPGNRDAAIRSAVAELTGGGDPDFRKFKFFVPAALNDVLTPEEAARLTDATATQRARAARLKMVYPHVSDEFSLDADFLASALDLESGPTIPHSGTFFTIGSCFARNIAEFLACNGYDAAAFQLAEDLNSPISNAFLFRLTGASPEKQEADLAYWVRQLFPEYSESELRAATAARLDELAGLVDQIRAADCVVLTLGNVVDFFRKNDAPETELFEKIFPKFIALPGSEDIQVRSNAASRLKSKGATLRLASYDETREAIRCCIDGLRKLTHVPIVVTLSPVPIDSVIGLSETELRSAIEVDCVSKSRLRSALHEVMVAENAKGSAIHYFPSFEIVRWIAPMLEISSFGHDDAASRHVSSPILDAVCALFLKRFLKLAAAQERGAPKAAQSQPGFGAAVSYQVSYSLATTAGTPQSSGRP